MEIFIFIVALGSLFPLPLFALWTRSRRRKEDAITLHDQSEQLPKEVSTLIESSAHPFVALSTMSLRKEKYVPGRFFQTSSSQERNPLTEHLEKYSMSSYVFLHVYNTSKWVLELSITLCTKSSFLFLPCMFSRTLACS